MPIWCPPPIRRWRDDIAHAHAGNEVVVLSMDFDQLYIEVFERSAATRQLEAPVDQKDQSISLSEEFMAISAMIASPGSTPATLMETIGRDI